MWMLVWFQASSPFLFYLQMNLFNNMYSLVCHYTYTYNCMYNYPIYKTPQSEYGRGHLVSSVLQRQCRRTPAHASLALNALRYLVLWVSRPRATPGRGTHRIISARKFGLPAYRRILGHSELKGSIGEGPNRSNHSNHSNSFKRGIFPRKIQH